MDEGASLECGSTPQAWLQPELPFDAERPPVEWMGFSADTTDEQAQGKFFKTYGFYGELRRDAGSVRVGPIPDKDAEEIMKRNKQNVRKLTVPPEFWRIQAWFNYKTGKFEAYKKPETDEAALAHMPQDGFVEPVYRALRGQGFSILASMRETFIKIEEMKGEREAKAVA